MVWTLDRTTGVDRTYTTGTIFGPTAGTQIYSPGGGSPIADINITGMTWLSIPAAELSTLNGNGASDRLVTGATNDLVIWDTGTLHDLIFADLSLLGRARLPSATANARIERFDLGNGNDIINLTANPNGSPVGASPGNYLWAVTVYGGDGNDVIASGEAGDILVGDDNSGLPPTDVRSDTIWGFGGNDTIFGDDGSIDPATTVGLADTLFGGDGNDLIYADGGDDMVQGGSGTDTIYGAGGNDIIYGEDLTADVIPNTDDTIYAGAGVDSVYGGVGNDTIFGEAGSDHLFGDVGSDMIDGGGGIDTIQGGGGADSLSGGNNSDVLYGDGVLESFFDGNDTLDGGDNADSLYGGGGNDVLRGGTSTVPFVIDSLFGGTGNDLFQFDAGEGVNDGGQMMAWDGVSANAIAIDFSGTANISSDRFFGDDGLDTLALNNGVDIFTVWDGSVKAGNYNYGGAGAQRLTGVELIIAGGGADYILMNHLSTGGGDPNRVWADDVTIAGMGQNDTIFSGSGNDVLWGDLLGNGTGAPSDGDDFLVGGAGNDTIMGAGGNDVLYGGPDNDRLIGGDGNDTIYGGGGQDSLIGDAGDDVIFGGNASDVDASEGSDIVVMQYSNAGGNFSVVTGKDSADPNEDGADQVYVSGSYNSVEAKLGGHDDRYIASSTDSGTPQRDIVGGELGNDLISTWYGNDELSGNEGEDALWGGAGSDTINGGPGTDYLYGGFGNNDVLVGGPGTDYYYYSRTDGQGDQIFDDFRGTDPLPGQQADNVLVVFPDFDPTEVNGDGLRTGSGVFETDHDLYDLAGGDDMVRLTDIDGAAGSMYRLTILTGDGATNYVEFDQRDVQTILLWNNDAAPGAQVIQTYTWDPVDGRYEFVS